MNRDELESEGAQVARPAISGRHQVIITNCLTKDLAVSVMSSNQSTEDGERIDESLQKAVLIDRAMTLLNGGSLDGANLLLLFKKGDCFYVSYYLLIIYVIT